MKRLLVAMSIALSVGVALLVLRVPSSARIGDKLYSLAERKVLTFSEALSDLRSARIILIGESHDNKKHHDIQLEVIRRLHDAGVKVSIGLEMFRRDDQKVLDRWSGGLVEETELIKAYTDNWNAPWLLYADIFHYARNKRLPMVGLNVPREITRQVAEGGFSSLSEEQRKQLPPVSCAIDEEYKRFIMRALDMHGHHRMDFTNFCEAQMLWDTAMAWHAVETLKAHPDRLLLILAGSGHAWKPGIPRHIASFSDFKVRVILPEIEGKTDAATVTEQDADYLWVE